MNVSFRKIVFWGVIAVGSAAFVWVATRPELVPVDIVTLERGVLEVTINADGKTRLRDIYEVSAPVSGRLNRSPVHVGDMVAARTDVIAVIQPGEPSFLDERSRIQAEAAVSQAEAALAFAETRITASEANLNHAQLQLSRLQELHNRGTVPQAQLEEAELLAKIAAAELESANATHVMRESELASQRALLIEPHANGDGTAASACCIQITAPVSGAILSVVNESTRMVSVGMPILSIGQMEDMEIAVDLLSTDAVRIALGAPAYVERWGGQNDLRATVRKIEPTAFTKVSALGIEEQRVHVLLDFVSPLSERTALGHGFRVFLRIVEWREEDVLRVPVGALFRAAGEMSVFVYEDDTARLRHIEIGQRNTDYAEVVRGLESGEQIILHPSDRVSDGTLVVDREQL